MKGGGGGFKDSRGRQFREEYEVEGGVRGGMGMAEATVAVEWRAREEGGMYQRRLLRPFDGGHGIGKRRRERTIDRGGEMKRRLG